MSKWKEHAGAQGMIRSPGVIGEAYLRERNEALDLLETMLGSSFHAYDSPDFVRASEKARYLLARLRVKDCQCTTVKDGAVIQVDDLGKCPHCGRCVANPRQTVRERVEAHFPDAYMGSVMEAIFRLLADAIDELKEKVK